MSTHDQTYPRGGITQSEFNVAGPLSQNSTYKRNYLDLCRHMIKCIPSFQNQTSFTSPELTSINEPHRPASTHELYVDKRNVCIYLFDFLKCTYKLSQLLRKSSCLAYVERFRHWYAEWQLASPEASDGEIGGRTLQGGRLFDCGHLYKLTQVLHYTWMLVYIFFPDSAHGREDCWR